MSPEVITKWANRVKIVNAYGPTEASVVATVNSSVSLRQNPSCIGHGISATLTWIVDPTDHNRLSPLGAVGELVLQGPTLARGYINDAQKTAEAFTEKPAWAEKLSPAASLPPRIHKTGDLVRYNSDGSLEYIGRKDNQVKLHGQRIDLGEIEHRLDTDPRIRHLVVLLPKTGLYKKRLVVVLSLESLAAESTVLSSGSCELVREETRFRKACSELVQIKDRLAGQLPSYMVPQTWAVVEALPMLVSGKLDRKKIAKWIENIDEQDYDHIARTKRIEKLETPEKPVTGVVSVLQQIWAQVLNLPLEKVKLDQSFLSLGKQLFLKFLDNGPLANCKLGGDSITAMAVVSRSRKQRINLSLHDILRSESITQLAVNAGEEVSVAQHEEETDKPFGLSPIQHLYFESAKGHQGRSRFNQSFLLRLTRRTEAHVLEHAIRAIISQHSMLRARFSKSSDGSWQQRISNVCILFFVSLGLCSFYCLEYFTYTFYLSRKLIHLIAIESIVESQQAQYNPSSLKVRHVWTYSTGLYLLQISLISKERANLFS